MKSYTIAWNNHCLELGPRTLIMGIVNVTPDSFSDGGRFYHVEDAVAQGKKLVEQGADILDIGGESTRPFSAPVSADEEAARVLPVIEKLAAHVSVPISIDTTKADVADKALAAGASIINDVSALAGDPDMARIAAKSHVPVILMHMKGTPETMQVEPHYDDLIGEICSFFENAIAKGEENGISRDRMILDPGIGFGKTILHNLQLIRNLLAFETLDLPLLIGPSRKAFIRTLEKEEGTADIPPDSHVTAVGTQAAVTAAALNGAHIVRVHDVADTLASLKIADAVKSAGI